MDRHNLHQHKNLMILWCLSSIISLLDQSLECFMIIFEKSFPATNNAAEGYNYRMSAIFSHIYEFVGRLKDEHEFQHHKSEEVQVEVKKRKQVYR